MSFKEKKERFNVFLVLIILMALACIAQCAKADDLSGILCDSREQAESIPKAHIEHGYEAGVLTYQLLKMTPNEDMEPTCVFFAHWAVTPVAQVSRFDNLEFPDGKPKTFYVLQVQAEDKTFWLISVKGLGAEL